MKEKCNVYGVLNHLEAEYSPVPGFNGVQSPVMIAAFNSGVVGKGTP